MWNGSVFYKSIYFHVRTFLQSSCEMFTQQLFLNGGDQRFSGGQVGTEEKLTLQIRAYHVTSNCERHSLCALV